MRTPSRVLLLATLVVAACATNPDKRTLSDLHRVEPDVSEVRLEDGLEEAMSAYKKFLAEAPESAMTPEALRRLADLKLEKEYGYLGMGSDGAPQASAQPVRAVRRENGADADPSAVRVAQAQADAVGPVDTSGERSLGAVAAADEPALPGGEKVEWAGPLEAIELYDRILQTYPNYAYNDWVLYQKARAYDELGRNDEAIEVVESLISAYPSSRYIDEAQFRRAEYFFTRKRLLDAEEAYGAIVAVGPSSDYYELAIYKLGWTLYKQEMHEEALDQYIALLDHKVASGYDFDQTADQSDERRMADTYRVISLSFSSLGGSSVVRDYFAGHGERSYEDRVYRQLGEYYFEKLRYYDAAESYKAFVDLKPLHVEAPDFSMRVVEIYQAGGFPKLVLESKKEFAAQYGLETVYWQHFDPAESPDVLRDLKANLEDLANHYHAAYQDETLPASEKPGHFDEAQRWYRAYLVSFSEHEDAPGVHYQMADLLLEHEDFSVAALEYEATAYSYAPHAQASDAGYAAIFAHREAEKRALEAEREGFTKAAVASSVRFVDTYSEHQNAAAVLGAAAQDLYDMKQLDVARAAAKRLIDDFEQADPVIRRAAWAVFAHSNFDLTDYQPAEDAYQRVLAMTPEDDDSRQSVVDSLAAAVYKQGEEAGALGDDRAAAEHFLRVAEVAPTSEIRPIAEYDAGLAYVRLEDWASASRVLEAFREVHPEHSLLRDATKQVAIVYKKMGDSARAAGEYERVAAEAEDPATRAEALLVAGELHEEAEAWQRALSVYELYVEEFSDPLEVTVETRFKMASLHERQGDTDAYHAQLRRIVRIDQQAGELRTPRIRYLAARSALVAAEVGFETYATIELVQPFDKSLKKKQRKMNETVEAFDRLVDYEAGDVTAAATYYIAEIYFEFSRALLESERPTGLNPSEELAYEDVLEEEAFPFEERALEVHEKNLELMSAGIFNSWVDRSLGKLAVLMPGRYAKFESSTGLLPSLERYAYRLEAPRPSTPEPVAPAEEQIDPVPAAPADLDGPVDSASFVGSSVHQAAG